jgi:RimJ/RimL family protein N-acetyltransferase
MIAFETERLLFRDHEQNDLDAYCAMEADPEVRRYVGGAPRTREAAEKKFLVHLKPRNPRWQLWATVYKPEGCYIGYCGVYHGHAPREGVLGYYLARPYWGRGLGTEAARAFVDFAFNDLDFTRVIASVQDGHAASMRIMEKLGYEHVRFEPGEQRSFHHFALER